MKKITTVLGLTLTLLSLAACKPKPKETKKTEMKTDVIAKQKVANHQDIRLKFNDIHLAKAADDFVGGTNLATLKTMFGEPAKHEDVPAGEVTIDRYTWNFDNVILSVHLYEDSAIGDTISNFEFVRDAFITMKDFEALKVSKEGAPGDNFKTISDKLGQPDMISLANSSDKEEIEAVWTSGLKTDSHATLILRFENNLLISKEQTNLTN